LDLTWKQYFLILGILAHSKVMKKIESCEYSPRTIFKIFYL
jgi:hypothetical protein